MKDLEKQLDEFIAVEAINTLLKHEIPCGEDQHLDDEQLVLIDYFKDGANLLSKSWLEMYAALQMVAWHHEDPIDRGLGDDAEQALASITKMLLINSEEK